MERLKTLLTVLLCLAVIVAVIGYNNVQNGYYFSGEALIQHAVNDFPNPPDLSDSSHDFFTVTDIMLTWCGNFIDWVFGFNPWVKGTPPYRGEIPWKAVI